MRKAPSTLANFIPKDLISKVNFKKFSFYSLKIILGYFKKNKKPSTLNNQNLYDAINFLNSHLINEISKLILNNKKIYIFCSKKFLETSKNFSNSLLKIDIDSSVYLEKHLINPAFNNCLAKDYLFLFIGIDCDKFSPPPFLKDIQTVNIESTINSSKYMSDFDFSVNLNNPKIKNVSKKNKIKIFLNCVYLNTLSRKLNKKQPD